MLYYRNLNLLGQFFDIFFRSRGKQNIKHLSVALCRNHQNLSDYLNLFVFFLSEVKEKGQPPPFGPF
jgi:hypothetical protein